MIDLGGSQLWVFYKILDTKIVIVRVEHRGVPKRGYVHIFAPKPSSSNAVPPSAGTQTLVF